MSPEHLDKREQHQAGWCQGGQSGAVEARAGHTQFQTLGAAVPVSPGMVGEVALSAFTSFPCTFFGILHFCCCSVTKLCPTLCDPMTTAYQASLSFTVTRSLLKFMSFELVMSSNHLIIYFMGLNKIHKVPHACQHSQTLRG